MVRRLPLVLAVLVALLAAAPAAARTVVAKDREGRSIRFDVQASGADVAWYAELLRNAAHADEIERVTIRIVAFDDLRLICGAGAGGCYRGSNRAGRIVVPAGKSPSLAHTVLHEYAHHVDAWYGVAGVREPNGTRAWWEARQMARLLREGAVARDYSRGWQRAIGEVFAEDYVQLHLTSPYRIGWLAPPDEAVVAALRDDVPGAPAAPADPPATPVVVIRRATLPAGAARSVPFELLGPGRRVTFRAQLATSPSGARARIEIRCRNQAPVTRPLVRGRATTLDLRNRGPAVCTAVVRNTGRTRATVASKLRLTLEPGAPPARLR